MQGKVGLVSGGGAGHEPMHGGFVGPGMLDAACAGEVFTSPVPDQMVAATQGVDGGAGVLHIVKNYTGDVMNFEMAAELVAAESGTEVVTVVVDDDVAVQDSLYTAGRRGVGTTVLLEKIVGAAAEEGRPLAAVADLARRIDDSGRSMGMALTSCTVPAAGKPTFELPEGEMEIGIGIHGEPGRRRVPIAPARDVAAMLVEPILADHTFSDGVICFVNGLGGTPLIELYVVYAEVAAILEKSGIGIARSLVGPYMTSLEMAGCSVTLLQADDELLRLWDAPVDTPGSGGAHERRAHHRAAHRLDHPVRRAGARAPGRAHRAGLRHRGRRPRLEHGPRDDRRRGRADRGSPDDPAALLKKTGATLVSKVGGASGPLYGTLFLRMAGAVGEGFAPALRAGFDGVLARGKAEPGDKTMVDALGPACDVLDAGGSVAEAAQAAADGRDATVPLVARKGRASYLGERSAGHADPGATSTAYLLQAAAETLS
ncbi:dihydroxyacetone kinase subunit DhaK [Klenkia terrae]|uniref:dihydroxyacetone kinase subunit DhaK n=1 Tax=Klenkia terrae TaxID=1052259 RepID=UPI00361B08A0